MKKAYLELEVTKSMLLKAEDEARAVHEKHVDEMVAITTKKLESNRREARQLDTLIEERNLLHTKLQEAKGIISKMIIEKEQLREKHIDELTLITSRKLQENRNQIDQIEQIIEEKNALFHKVKNLVRDLDELKAKLLNVQSEYNLCKQELEVVTSSKFENSRQYIDNIEKLIDDKNALKQQLDELLAKDILSEVFQPESVNPNIMNVQQNRTNITLGDIDAFFVKIKENPWYFVFKIDIF